MQSWRIGIETGRTRPKPPESKPAVPRLLNVRIDISNHVTRSKPTAPERRRQPDRRQNPPLFPRRRRQKLRLSQRLYRRLRVRPLPLPRRRVPIHVQRLRATSALPRVCPRGVEAAIWYDECMLRYSNESFIGHADRGFNATVTATVTGRNLSRSVEYRREANSVVAEAASAAANEAAFGGGGN
ncbi:LOW QUALITY PROTEIN: hypothetical protein V2J09_017429 [Rumex salicifolius]